MSSRGLKRLVQRYQSARWQRPIAAHTQQAFEAAYPIMMASRAAGQSLWLDSCCGVGASTVMQAQQHPDAFVTGVDKSAHRLGKQGAYARPGVRNYQLLRAECIDFWHLLHRAGVCLDVHSLWYPNPWPKPGHLQRRWYAMPVMAQLVGLQKYLTVRSNCLWYLEDFAWALRWWGFDAVIRSFKVKGEAMTPFEHKYAAAGQQLWVLSCAFAAFKP